MSFYFFEFVVPSWTAFVILVSLVAGEAKMDEN